MTTKTLKFAVILAGCGNKDGSEIHESVLTLLSIDKRNHAYQCFAPDVPQSRVINFLNNEELKDKRNVLQESARIARSKIRPLVEFKVQEFDILVLPGGSGVAHNLCTFARQADAMTINPDVERAVKDMHAALKPIGALCIAPVILGKLLPDVTITFGQDEKTNAIFQRLGAKTINTNACGIVVDKANKVVTTPCYMLDARISELAEGIDKLIGQLAQMV